MEVSTGTGRVFSLQVDRSRVASDLKRCREYRINIAAVASMAFFPFCGWRESFFGDLRGQGTDAVEFFTQK